MKQIRVTVPASTGNLGPGFDCLGLALSLYNDAVVTESAAGLQISIEGEGEAILPTGADNMVYQMMQRLFARAGWQPAGLEIQLHNDIPVSSGLGSSAAAIVTGLLAANALVPEPLPVERLREMAVAAEGHPDNVTAALYGGLTLINQDLDQQRVEHVEQIPLPPLTAVIVLPAFALSTAAARAALPRAVSLPAATFNAGRTALLLRALEAGDYTRLRLAMADQLHQPYRMPLVPGMAAAFAAAQARGAAVAISGAGPSVIAFSPGAHEALAQAIAQAFSKNGLASRYWILPVDHTGGRVSKAAAAISLPKNNR